jgi:hypothetical protein
MHLKKNSYRYKLKISNSLKGKIHSKETKEKMVNSALGRHHTVSQSKKLSTNEVSQ